MTATRELHRVELADNSVLIFNHDGNEYRIALYRRRRPNDKGGELDSSYFDDLVRRELLPRGYYTGWFRVATAHKTFAIGLARAYEAANLNLDPYITEKYIRSTSWGCELP